MRLTDTTIRKAKPASKPVRLADGGGMYLEITPNGSKLWRMQYRFGDKRKMLAFGKYPVITLADARARREEAKKLLANGQDPSAVKAAQKAVIQEQKAAQQATITNKFEAVAHRWFEFWKKTVTPAVASRQWSNLSRHVFPELGNLTITEVKRKVVKETLSKIEAQGMGNTVIKAKAAISMTLTYAEEEGLIESNPIRGMSFELQNSEVKHMAALTDPKAVGALMRAIDDYRGKPEVMAALKLAPYVFVRPGELRGARWTDIDLEKSKWCYIPAKTKKRQKEHLVPLSRQAVEILRGIHAMTGKGELVFPNLIAKDRPISNSTINSALHRMGYCTQTEMTGHGFRAMARTLLAEELHYSPEVIEHQLAHGVSDALGTAYNRTKYLKERIAMMQAWADYLDELKTGTKITPPCP